MFGPFFSLTGCANFGASGGFSNAHKYYQAGDYLSAIVKVDRSILKYEYPPETLAQLYLLKAQSYEKLNHLENARSVYLYIKDNFANTSAYQFAVEKLLWFF